MQRTQITGRNSAKSIYQELTPKVKPQEMIWACNKNMNMTMRHVQLETLLIQNITVRQKLLIVKLDSFHFRDTVSFEKEKV